MSKETKVDRANSSGDSLLARSHAWLMARAWWQLIAIFIAALVFAAFDTVIIDWLPFIDEAFLYGAVLFIGRAVLEKATR